MAVAVLLLAAIDFMESGRLGRPFLFFPLWISGIVGAAIAIFLYLSFPLFDQDLMIFPYYKIFLLVGLFALLFAQIAAFLGGRSTIFLQLAEEKQQRAISEITQVAVSSTSLMELLNFTLDKIVGMLGMAAGTIHVFHRARQNLVLGSYKGLSARLARRLETVEFGETAIGRTAKNKRLLIIRNLRLSPDYEVFGGKAEGFSYMAMIPIISEGEHWGVISLFGKGGYRPGLLQVDLLEQFGEQLGSTLVLGRRMRATQSSLESMRGLIGSLGDELYAGTKLRDNSPGAVRAIAWSLTRILNGDRFDLCRKAGSNWITVLSSEPEADNEILTIDPESEFNEEPRLSGLVGWDQIPPFKEFMERRPYIFCSMPDKETWMFIRLESRRRVTVDFDFFYDACRIIFSLSKIMTRKDTRNAAAPEHTPKAALSEEPEIPGLDALSGQISGTFDRISHDLEKLIEEYSSGDSNVDIKELMGWLEVIRKAAYDGKNIIESRSPIGRPEEPLPDDLDAIVLKAIDRLAATTGESAKIEFEATGRTITLKYPARTVSDLVTKFLKLAVGSTEIRETLALASERDGETIVLRLTGNNLPAPIVPRPQWLSEIGARLEYASEESEDGKSVDSWRLIMPGISPAENKKGKHRVLAVDTRDIIRDLLTGMLKQLGYEPVLAESSVDAIKLFEQAIVSGNRFDIVIADNSLDELSGLRMASRMKTIDPDIFFLLTPAWGMEPDPALARKSGVDLVLEKPFRIEQLAEAVEEATRKASGT